MPIQTMLDIDKVMFYRTSEGFTSSTIHMASVTIVSTWITEVNDEANRSFKRLHSLRQNPFCGMDQTKDEDEIVYKDIKSRRPSTAPCGTPLFVSIHSLNSPMNLNLYNRSLFYPISIINGQALAYWFYRSNWTGVNANSMDLFCGFA